MCRVVVSRLRLGKLALCLIELSVWDPKECRNPKARGRNKAEGLKGQDRKILDR
jgi:hypothetical protein